MCNVQKVESLYRQALKTALSVRNSVNNEIVYVESGEYPLEVRIAQQQIKFWTSMQMLSTTNPSHNISKLIAATEDTKYIKHYKHLVQKYTDPDKCTDILSNEFRNTFVAKIRSTADLDINSRLGTYAYINPSLTQPSFENKLEFQRVIITRYRTGSHNLRIESGRTPYIPREERLCLCNNDLQTISHVMLHCPILTALREKYAVVDVENGLMIDNFLLEMEKALGIK